MNNDLDRILASEELLTPSVGFVNRVTAAVRRAHDHVAPIRFPWQRFAVGLAAGCLCTLLSGAILLARDSAGLHGSGPAAWIQPTQWSYATAVLCLTMALIGSLLVVRISVDLTTE